MHHSRSYINSSHTGSFLFLCLCDIRITTHLSSYKFCATFSTCGLHQRGLPLLNPTFSHNGIIAHDGSLLSPQLGERVLHGTTIRGLDSLLLLLLPFSRDDSTRPSSPEYRKQNRVGEENNPGSPMHPQPHPNPPVLFCLY